jgi:predicted tellurium resistance membrane protein TerC
MESIPSKAKEVVSTAIRQVACYPSVVVYLRVVVKYGVGVLLMFTGVKLLGLIFGLHISTVVSIGIIFFVIITSIVVSLVLSREK